VTVRFALAAQSPPGSAGAAVMLADGVYRLSAPLTLAAADSGTPGHPVVWQAVSGAHPALSGAIQVTGWTETDAVHGIWAATVPAGIQSRDLYVNGVPAPMSQVNVDTLGFNYNWVGSSDGYDISGDPAAVTYLDNLAAAIGPTYVTGLQFVYPGGDGAWTQSSCPVQSISGSTITMQQPCWYDVTNRPYYNNSSGYFGPMSPNSVPNTIENAYPLLNPGQWFYDASAQKLYYMPLLGQQMSSLDVELPQLEVLLNGSGAHDLTFTGLTFTGTTWNDDTGPSSSVGFADVQANLRITQTIALQQTAPQGLCTSALTSEPGTCPFGSWPPPPTSVQFTNATNLTLTGNTFTDLGVAGLGIYGGSHATLVQGNTFFYIASSAIEIGSSLDAPTTQSQTLLNTTINNNVIHHIGTEYPSAPGITIFYSQYSTITNNEIFHVPYDGMSSGVAGGHDDTPPDPTVSNNVNEYNVISNNLIHNFMEVLNDGGAIYMEGHQGQSWDTALNVSGTVAYSNIGYGNALYTDAGAEWINLAGNALWDYSGWSAVGGCEPTGHLHTSGNYYPSNLVVGGYGCWSGTFVDTVNTNNLPIPGSPGPADLPSSLLSAAGLQGQYQSLSLALPPEIDYTGATPASGSMPAQALIAGVGFGPSTQVSFNGADAASLQVLSDGFITASLPALSGGIAFPLGVTLSGNSGTATSIFEANAVGIFTDGTSLSSSGFDGEGYAYSASLLGTSQTWNGVTFTFGPANNPDAVRGRGQAIVLPSGEFGHLLMLGAAVNGNQTFQTFTVTYADGTTSSFTQDLSDWSSPAGYSGETTVVTMPYRDVNNGATNNSTFYLYGYEFPLNNAKTAESLALPNNPNVVFLGIALAP
jgi:hypothetical protein